MRSEVMESLRVVWDSLYSADELEQADVVMAFGCADPMVVLFVSLIRSSEGSAQRSSKKYSRR